MIIDLNELNLVIELRRKHRVNEAHLVPSIRPRGSIIGEKMTLAIQFTDVEEALIPVVVFDQDGEEIPVPEGTTVQAGTSDNTEVATVQASDEIIGLLVQSVGDDQPNVGDANISGVSITLPNGEVMPLEDIVVAVSFSAAGSAGFGSGVNIRPRS